MLSIRQNLETREAAVAFNKRIYDYRCDYVAKGGPGSPGCIGELACEHCFHVISDSICLCVGVFTCPKCGAENGGRLRIEPIPPTKGQFVWVPAEWPDTDYSI